MKENLICILFVINACNFFFIAEERMLECNKTCGDVGRCAVTKKIDACYCDDRYKLYNNSECVQGNVVI